MNCKIHPKIQRWIDIVENEEIRCCKEQKLLVNLVRKSFETEAVYTDGELLEQYLRLVKYLGYESVFEWEEFLVALHDCTFWKQSGLPRWPFLFLYTGRGTGKDGFIAWDSLCMVSPFHRIKFYDVDICANNEEQAMRPLNDILEAFESDRTQEKKLRRYFNWNKTKLQGKAYRGVVKGRTNNPKGKDGMRSGKVVFNEVHQYQDYANINVFKTGLGKKKHARELVATTDGDVREGPLDEWLEDGRAILEGAEADNGMLPFICRLDSDAEVHDPKNWTKAIPSLLHLPSLEEEIRREYSTWKKNPASLPAFLTKRFNRPQGRADLIVTDWENIKATNRPLPDLEGWNCIAGIDYATLNDWASVNLHFKDGDRRFDINHSWVCKRSKHLEKIKAPWQEWAKEGKITIVDEPEIPPELIAGYLEEAMQRYNILLLVLDNFRFALLKKALSRIGFEDKLNIKQTRPSDIMKVAPVVVSCFAKQLFTWGDYAPLRWATNNTKLEQTAKRTGTDTGNYYFAKIEGKSRKTDPFMALVHSMTEEEELGEGGLELPPDEGCVQY